MTERPTVAVVFIDLLGCLVTRGGQGRFEARPEALDLMPASARIGLLCNLPPGRTAADAVRILDEANILERFEPDLLIAASDLPCPLPDRRAFAVAAALAEAAPAECRFVSSDPVAVAAAQASGFDAVVLPGLDAGPGLFADEPLLIPQLLAGEVDEDIGPTFVLHGRVVTMTDPGEVFDDAHVVVSRGAIVALLKQGEQVPPGYAQAPRIETEGTIFPGLIDLHNHFVYNVLPLWKVPKQYHDRSEWPRSPDYAGMVTLPVRALAERASTAKAIVRYVEAKALIGGTTTGQGMRTRVNGGPRLFHGAMRNVEETKDVRLPEAGTLVPTLYVNPERVNNFRAALTNRVAYFYHLAEGTADRTRRAFTDLQDNDLLKPALVGIHCLGLKADDLKALCQAGAKCVWSPFSNSLLYGKTLDLASLLAADVPFAIGCDWTPTGSKNLLEELKVARWTADNQGAPLSNEQLIRAVTINAARILGWGQALGTIESGRLADLIVVRGNKGDPYDQLVTARESAIALLVIHGIARYGDQALMEKLDSTPDTPLEHWSLNGTAKAFNLQTPGSDLNSVSFADATETLQTAMSDLIAFRASSDAEEATLNAMGLEAPSFTLELDNEYEPSPDDALAAAEPSLMADWDQIAPSVDLDEPTVGGDNYWDRIEAQPNIAQGLKESLRAAYG